MLSLGRQVIQQSDIDPQSFHKEFSGEIDKRGFDFACAMSGLEIALWDLQGKIAESPGFTN